MAVKIFGVPLDPLDTLEHLGAKLEGATGGVKNGGKTYSDPYHALTEQNADVLSRHGAELLGQLDVKGFLRPRPPPEDAYQLTQTDYGVFLDTGGCLEYASAVHDFIKEKVLPDPFLILGVDHSTTAGAVQALSENEDLALVVFDAHYDGVDPRVKTELSRFVLESNPAEYAKLGITEASWAAMSAVEKGTYFACGNFLERVLHEGWVKPENTFVIGVCDYPDKELLSNPDPRVREYVEAFTKVEERGLTFVMAGDLRKNTQRELTRLTSRLKDKTAYFSVDLDVAFSAGAIAVRFPNMAGLDRDTTGKLLDWIKGISPDRVKLAGADILELDVHLADLPSDAGKTYRVAGRFMSAVLEALGGSG